VRRHPAARDEEAGDHEAGDAAGQEDDPVTVVVDVAIPLFTFFLTELPLMLGAIGLYRAARSPASPAPPTRR
jgi:hypothetical protein